MPELGLADSYSVSRNGTAWSFRVRPGKLFSNGNPLRVNDAVFSLKLCQQAGSFKGINFWNTRRGAGGERREEWLDIRCQEGGCERVPEKTWSELSSCPILEQQSSEAFGETLGQGTNLVGAGQFFVSSFIDGKEVTLTGISGSGRKTVNRQIVLRGYSDLFQALTAIRTGSIDAVVIRPAAQRIEEMLEKVKKDETLSHLECSNYILVLRRGLDYPCDPRVDLSKVEYRDWKGQ